MAAPARAAAASVSGAFGLSPDPAAAARCSFDQTRRRAEELQQDKRLVRTLVNVYGQAQQEGGYPKEAVMAAVEECMRKQAEGLLHSLEGIGGRLSQLELYCYKLERSIGELRSDIMDYHSEGTVNFRCLEKNLRQTNEWKWLEIRERTSVLVWTLDVLTRLIHNNCAHWNRLIF